MALAARQSTNALLMRGLATHLGDENDLAEVLEHGDPRHGTPFFYGLTNELLSKSSRGGNRLTHDVACAARDSFARKESLPKLVADPATDSTLFPRLVAESHVRHRSGDAGDSPSFCIALRHPNVHVLGMTGYYRRHATLRRRIAEHYPLSRFAGEMEEALDVLRTLHREIHDRVCGACTFVAPVRTPPGRHLSFTVDGLPRIVFLSPAEDPFRLACTVAHEFAHYELNCLQRHDSLVLTEFSEVPCYSPWRDDPRHPSALLHALYVFCEVAGLLTRRLSGPDLPSDDPERIEAMERRFSLLRARLRSGLNEVRDGHLTAGGQELLRRMAHFVNEVLAPGGFEPEMDRRVHQEKLDRVASWGGLAAN